MRGFSTPRSSDVGRAQGNPVPQLVRVLTEAVSEASQDAARYVHKGATSQDIVDTAAMLLARRALDLILVELDEISKACARLAYAHRETIMVGRTLLQQALPTTFGLKAAGWLVSVLEARRKLLDVRLSGLAAQLGGQPGRWLRSAAPGSPFSRGSRGSLVSRSPYYRGTRTEPESQNSGLLYRLSPASLGRSPSTWS